MRKKESLLGSFKTTFMINSDTNNCPINIKMRSSPICWKKKKKKNCLKLKTDCNTAVATLPLIYEQWIQALATAVSFSTGMQRVTIETYGEKTTLRACEQMLSTTLRWNGTRSVCKRAENINYKVRSLRWSMLEEAHAAHVCCAPDGLFWEIRSSRHRDGSVWVARVERWREKKKSA